MTRTRALLFVVFAFIATLAFGQTYVRPSKGVAFFPFTGMTADAGFVVPAPGLTVLALNGPMYEWTSFDAVQVRVWTDPNDLSSVNTYGQLCSSFTRNYIIPNVGPFVKFRRYRLGQSGTYLQLMDAPTVSAPFNVSTAPNASVSLINFSGCTAFVQVTPLPFSPATVAQVDGDGGTTNAQSGPPFQCPHVYQNTYLMDGGIIEMGRAPSGVGRYYTIVCNSKDNTSGNLRCRADDAGVVSTTAGSIGDVLGVGDCINYSNPVANPIHCIGGSIYATTFECSP